MLGYALEHVATANRDALQKTRDALVGLGRMGGDLRERARRADDTFFSGGQPWLGDVYYQVNTAPFFAYCLLRNRLSPGDRKIVESGFKASARFRMRAMDRWTQTPNLVFKPTSMVAMAGLVTGDEELIDWGFYRKGADLRLGGYFTVLDRMLVDGGPWNEAPLYPLAHKSLWMMEQVSDMLSMTRGGDWFSRQVGDGSPRGLMDYFIDSSWPMERTGYGAGQIRIASYGDGATDASQDLFLVNPAGPGVTAEAELGAAYALTGDGKYASFLKLSRDYQPGGIHRPPLPEKAPLPPAPSRAWPGFGFAMLRSDESPAYWTSPKVIAATMLMANPYGHGHADAFSITLHGANRLLYPDYNAVQYENPSLGWTAKTIAHNTVTVDEGESRKPGTGKIRQDFGSAAKFLSVSASGVYPGVEQSRSLLLTGEYLLDLFQLSSAVPHTWDYLLHSFGRPEPVGVGGEEISVPLGGRYRKFKAAGARRTGQPWQFDFVLDGAQVRKREAVAGRLWREKNPGKPQPESRYGAQWYAHQAAVRVTMAGVPDTEVVYGEGVQEMPMLVARRRGTTDELFAAAHEPWSSSAPKIRKVTQLVRSEGAVVVRVDAEDYTDYAAVAFGPGAEEKVQVLAPEKDADSVFAFRNYGYLRVFPDGRRLERGGWVGYRVPASGDGAGDRLERGKIPERRDPPLAAPGGAALEVLAEPPVVRLANWDKRAVTLSFRNTTTEAIAGGIRFQPPQGFGVQPENLEFGPLAPGKSASVKVTISSLGAGKGRFDLPFRLSFGAAGSERRGSAPQGLVVTVGRVLAPLYGLDGPPVYRVYAERYTADLAMKHGLPVRLTDDDGRPWLDGAPLFTISAEGEPVLDESTENAFTWPVEVPASLTAQANDRIRWQALFFFDRIAFRMDPGWTRFERVTFTLPGNWVQGEKAPVWRRVLVPGGKSGPGVRKAVPGKPMRIAAAELGFPERKQNLCFQFQPPQEVTLKGSGMEFDIGGLTGDMWTMGVCPANGLKEWRWK